MKKDEYELIAESIWRSGYIKDKNKVRQEAKEAMRRLVAIDISAALEHKYINFDREKFMAACGF
jgi:hypothetical protein